MLSNLCTGRSTGFGIMATLPHGLDSFLWVVGLNLVIGCCLLGLYALLRRAHPHAQAMYAPRLSIPEARGGCADSVGVERLFRIWRSGPLAPLLHLSDDDVLHFAGSDALVLLRALLLCRSILTPLVLLACPIAIIVFATAEHDFASLETSSDSSTDSTNPRYSFERWTSLAYVAPSSIASWVSVVIAYCATGFAILRLSTFYRSIALSRLNAFCNQSDKGFTVLLRDLPKHEQPRDCVQRDARSVLSPFKLGKMLLTTEVMRETVDNVVPIEPSSRDNFPRLSSDQVRSAITAMYPYSAGEPYCLALPPLSRFLAARAAYDSAHLRFRAFSGSPLDEGDTSAATSADEHSSVPPALLSNTDNKERKSKALTKAWKDLHDASNSLARVRTEMLSQPPSSAFVTFASHVDASTAAQVQHHFDVTAFCITPAPEPEEISYANLELSWQQRHFRSYLADGIFTAILIAFAPFLLFVTGLASYEHLALILPLDPSSRAGRSLVNTFLPGVISGLVISQMPPIFRKIARYEGAPSLSHIEAIAIRKQSLLLLSTLLFGTVFLVSVLRSLASFVNGSPDVAQVFSTLGSTIPYAQGFYFGFIGAKIAVELPLDCTRALGALMKGLKSCAGLARGDQWPSPPVNMAGSLPGALLIFTLGMVYAPIGPLVTVLALVYVVVAVKLVRYQLVFLNTRAFRGSSGYEVWPTFARRLMLALGLMQVMLAVTLALKGARNGVPAVVVMALVPVTYASYRRMEMRLGSSFGAMPRDVAAALDAKRGALMEEERREKVERYRPEGLEEEGEGRV